jgi:hypothetical protein
MTPLDILSFGAVPDGKTDNAAAINYALKVAKAQDQPVLVPVGDFAHADVLKVDGVEMYGEGDTSVLRALNPARAAVQLTGKDAALRSLRLTGVVPTERLSNPEAHRVTVIGATYFLVENVLIDTSAAGSLFVKESVDGEIVSNRLIGQPVAGADYTTMRADGIHMTGRASNITVRDNTVRRVGDDCIAVVSYQGQGGKVSKIRVLHNNVGDTVKGRGITVVGGKSVLIEDNMVADVRGAAGFYFAQEDSWKTYAPEDVIATRNTLRNTGNVGIGHYAVMVFCGTFERVNGVVLNRNNIVQPDPLRGIRVRDNCDGVVLTQNVIVSIQPMHLSAIPAPLVTAYTDGPVGVA